MKSLLILTITLFIAGCTSSKIEKDSMKNKNVPAKINWADKQIPPDHCRIIGTIVSIDTVLDTSVVNSPCSKVPCNAEVNVDSVLGYGSSFSPISVNKLIQVHFNFTLNPTVKDLFPNMTDHYPGLQVGSRFEGDIFTVPQMGNSSPLRKTYQINEYEVKEIKIF